MFKFIAENMDNKGVRIQAGLSGRHQNSELIRALYGIAEAIAKATGQTTKFVIDTLTFYADAIEQHPESIEKNITEIKLPKDIIDKL